MKKYEAVIILDEGKLDTSGENYAKEIASYIEESLAGKVELSESMGRKTFTYPIKKRNAGLYWNLVFEADATKVLELKDNYRLDQNILRFEVFVYDRPESPVTLTTKK